MVPKFVGSGLPALAGIHCEKYDTMTFKSYFSLEMLIDT